MHGCFLQSLADYLYFRLPPRMQNICLSLLKTIQEYEEVINEAAAGPQGIYHWGKISRNFKFVCCFTEKGLMMELLGFLNSKSSPLNFS